MYLVKMYQAQILFFHSRRARPTVLSRSRKRRLKRSGTPCDKSKCLASNTKMTIGRTWTAITCFIAPFPRALRQTHSENLHCLNVNSRNLQPFRPRTFMHASVVVLGGSSGVGKEVAKYLESHCMEVKVASRRTGYDFLDTADALKALRSQERAAISVGAGRRSCSVKDELKLYQAIASALSSTPQLELVIVVLRALILPEVQDIFQQMVDIPWVLIRPGPLVEREQTPELERVLVTPDMRCNGLVSRSAVGRVVGDMLLEKVPIPITASQIFGVYDFDRMISHPQGIEVIGKDIWQ